MAQLLACGDNRFNQLFVNSGKPFTSPQVFHFNPVALAEDELAIKCSTLKKTCVNLAIGWSFLIFTDGSNAVFSGFADGKPDSKSVLLYKVRTCAAGWSCGVLVTRDNRIVVVRDGDLAQPRVITCEEAGTIKAVGCMESQAILTDGERLFVLSTSSPAIVPGPSLPEACSVDEVSCGKDHCLLLTRDGRVLSFGLGSRGQLGHGDLDSVGDPREVTALLGVKALMVKAGGWHSAALGASGDLYTWGWNESGQLGVGTPGRGEQVSASDGEKGPGTCAEPRLIDFPLESNVTHVACGSRHSICVLDDASIYSWGNNALGQLGLPSDVTSVATPTLVDFRSGGASPDDRKQHVGEVWAGWSSSVVLLT